VPIRFTLTTNLRHITQREYSVRRRGKETKKDREVED